jgi:hypothetical protein
MHMESIGRESQHNSFTEIVLAFAKFDHGHHWPAGAGAAAGI